MGRRELAVAPLVAATAILAGCGSSATGSPAVPPSVQRAIAKASPLLAYVPTELPAGYRYAGHFSNPGYPVGITYKAPDGRIISFGVAHATHAACSRGRTGHVFTFGGVRAYWGGDGHNQGADRCVTRKGVTDAIWDFAEVPGDGTLSTPSARADALRLARLVASAKYVG